MEKQPLRPLINGNPAGPIEWDLNKALDYRDNPPDDLDIEREKIKEDARNKKKRKSNKKGK